MTMVVLVAPVRRSPLQLRRLGTAAAPLGYLRVDAAGLFDVVAALATAVGR
jgi:hypothetical protein